MDWKAYLKNTQHKNGMWDDTDEMLKFPHPPYMGPGIYTEYKTGMILKWLLRLNVSDKEMISGAQAYLIQVFEEVSSKNDFWSAIAYSGSFSLMPHIAEYPKIMEWSMKILMPQEGQFGGQQVMGMIEDDIPIPEQVYDVLSSLSNLTQERFHTAGPCTRTYTAGNQTRSPPAIHGSGDTRPSMVVGRLICRVPRPLISKLLSLSLICENKQVSVVTRNSLVLAHDITR